MRSRRFAAAVGVAFVYLVFSTGCASQQGPDPYDPYDPNAGTVGNPAPPVGTGGGGVLGGITAGQRAQAAAEGMVMGAVIGSQAGPIGAAIGAGTFLIYSAITGHVPMAGSVGGGGGGGGGGYGTGDPDPCSESPGVCAPTWRWECSGVVNLSTYGCSGVWSAKTGFVPRARLSTLDWRPGCWASSS